jgi:hypothetical protein
VTKGGEKVKFVWVMSQQKSFDALKFHLFLAPFVILPYLQQSFKIEIDASDYAIGVFLTQHGHLMAYHIETLYDVVRRYFTYDKDMYSIVSTC